MDIFHSYIIGIRMDCTTNNRDICWIHGTGLGGGEPTPRSVRIEILKLWGSTWGCSSSNIIYIYLTSYMYNCIQNHAYITSYTYITLYITLYITYIVIGAHMPTSVSTIVIPMNYLNFTPTFFTATGQREPKNGRTWQ